MRFWASCCYLAHDDGAKWKLKTAETGEKRLLKGDDQDPSQCKLITSTISKLVHDTATQKIKREFNMLNEINNCKRGINMSIECYNNFLKANLSKYVYHKNMESSTHGHQLAVIVMQNTNLSPDTWNFATFQITARASVRKGVAGTSSIVVPASDI